MIRQSRKSRTGRFQAHYHRPDPVAQPLRRLGRQWLSLGFFVITLIGLLWFVWLPLQINTNDNEFKAQLRADLPRGWFIWQIDELHLAARLQSDYPAQAGEVRIRRTLSPRRLQLDLATPQPQLRWQSGGQVYSVDRNGRLLGPESREGETATPLVEDVANLPIAPGQTVAPPEFVAFVREIAASQLAVKRFRIIDTTRELYAELEAGYEVRFSTGESANRQLQNVAQIQRLAEQQGRPITRYIDVWIPFKAYYR